MDIYRAEIIAPGDKASKLAHEVCVASYNNSPLVKVMPLQPGKFRGAVGFNWQPDLLEEMASQPNGNWQLA